jgi:hypothetical protein
MYGVDPSVVGSFIEQGFCSIHPLILSNLSFVYLGWDALYQISSKVEPLARLQPLQQQHIFDLTL